jgi:protein TonB
MHVVDPHHISNTRLRNTIATVLLAHLALLWATQRELAVLTASDESGQVIMADLVSDVPSPALTPQAKPVPQITPASQPVKPQAQTQEVALRTDSSTSSNIATATSAAPAVADSAKVGAPSLVDPSADADYLKNPPPAYPLASRRLGEQGTVIVRVFISTQGLPDKAEVRTSSGFARLDQAALEAVQRWRFVPGRRNGTPESMWFNIPVRFVLE